MSFTDRLVVNKGIDHEKAASTSLKLALPLFKELEAMGIDPESIESDTRS
jgi:hypothetical protein